MTDSPSHHDEERTLETVPLELLPLHQGLQEDGSNWRATLPQPDRLLRRMRTYPPGPADSVGTHAQPDQPTSSSDTTRATHATHHCRRLLLYGRSQRGQG